MSLRPMSVNFRREQLEGLERLAAPSCRTWASVIREAVDSAFGLEPGPGRTEARRFERRPIGDADTPVRVGLRADQYDAVLSYAAERSASANAVMRWVVGGHLASATDRGDG